MNTQIQNELIDLEAQILAEIDNQIHFKVPENYFSQTKTELILLAEKKEQLRVPDGYFSVKKEQLKSISSEQSTSLAKRFSIRPYLSVAASVVILIMVFLGINSEPSSDSQDYLAYFSPLEQAILNENVDTYFIDSFHKVDENKTSDFDELFSLEEVEPEFFN